MIHKTGSLSSYFRNGCRCVTCKSVASNWRKERMALLTPEQREAKRVRKNEAQRIRRAVSA